jgi:predicted RNA-binding protein YlqC (UPF0109 family)
MKPVIEEIVKSLVNSPAEVKIVEMRDLKLTRFRIIVSSSDFDRLSGKEAQIAEAVNGFSSAFLDEPGDSVEVDFFIDAQVRPSFRSHSRMQSAA